MSAVKTPAEIARCTFEKLHGAATKACEADVLQMLESAIETDRAQRDIYEMIAEALDERAKLEEDDDDARHPAAEVLRATSAEIVVDDTWDQFIGPMLDAIEEEYGR